MTIYPKPDFRNSWKMFVGMAAFLVFLHWIPDLATWIHSYFYKEALVVNMRRFHAILVVAYVMVGIAVTVNLAGLIWAIWHRDKWKQ